MLPSSHILLARGDDGGGWVGVLFFLVPFILWAIGTIAQKMNQKQAEERRRRLQEMMKQPPGALAPPPPLPIPSSPKRKPKVPPARRAPARRDEVILLPEAPVPVSRAPSVRPEEIVTERPKAPARAQAIHQWLSPQTLRKQFILTELFQPPLALRPPRDEAF